MSSRMCFLEIEDWHECKSRKKHRVFHNFINSEMDKLKIYSLPTYDHHTDTFKDGPLPKDVDSYFSKPIAEQKFYSWSIRGQTRKEIVANAMLKLVSITLFKYKKLIIKYLTQLYVNKYYFLIRSFKKWSCPFEFSSGYRHDPSHSFKKLFWNFTVHIF